MNTRPLLYRLLSVTAAIAMALAASELLVRIVWKDPGASTVIYEKRRPPRRSVPEFRTAAPSIAKPDTAYRIVALGDSFTWGGGVYPEDSWARRLEWRLQPLLPALDVEVINWSRPGWNTWEAWRSLEPELEELDPELLVVGYCLNDAEPSDPEERARLQWKWRIRDELADARRPVWIESWSLLARMSSDAIHHLRMKRKLSGYYHALYAQDGGWEEIKTALRLMGERARERGTRLLVVGFPIFDSQLDHRYRYRYRYRDLHNRVGRSVAGMGIAFLDLLPHYKGINARRLAVEAFADAHPSELAHRIAADRIVDFLVSQQWIESDPEGVWLLRYSRERSGLQPPGIEPGTVTFVEPEFR